MRPKSILAGTLAVLATLIELPCAHSAQGAPTCSAKVTRSTVVPCALAASPAVESAALSIEAARGQETAAKVLFPANPQLSLSADARSTTGQRAINWYATISQEIEIGGQRGARIATARAERTAQTKRAVVTQRDIAAAALIAYFDALAAREELALTGRLAGIANALAVVASERAQQGLSAPVDADVAYAASLRLIQARAAAERRASAALARLTMAVGLDPARGAPAIEGDLTPLPIDLQELPDFSQKALRARAEIDAAKAEAQAAQQRVSLLRRERIPNLTVSAFVQNDGFNERVFGGGVSVPIPLPWPLGKTNKGEIAAADSLARRADSEAERVRRQVRVEVVTAAQELASRRRELEAFDAQRLRRAEASLEAISQEITAGRLSIQQALLTQQTLIELLQAYIEAKRALCVASVELARAAGIPLDRGAP